jgi:Mrp family chromosome partitioning ATPase
MPTKKQITESLEKILVPDIRRSLVEMNLVREVAVAKDRVDIALASAALALPAQEMLKANVEEAVGKTSGVKAVTVSFSEVKPKDLNQIGHILAVMSGKGGVGKSLVASLTAVALNRQGYQVGILDADITGASIPRMFGIDSRPGGSESGILPVLSRSGIEVMSINLLLPSEDDAVIWRGPLIARAITQFWEEVLWGKLDYLIVDLPPGTADAPLTVMQTLPVSGVVIVFTPQDLTTMIVRKAVNMAQKMGKKVVGVVENMSYLYLPEIDKRIEVFGKSRGVEMATASGAPLLGQIPIDPALAKLCDEGDIERYDAEVVGGLGEALARSVPGEPEKKADSG